MFCFSTTASEDGGFSIIYFSSSWETTAICLLLTFPFAHIHRHFFVTRRYAKISVTMEELDISNDLKWQFVRNKLLSFDRG